jgi:P4 family phage/plasmid primase-like protien
MKIIEFIENNKLNFTAVNIIGLDENGKKVYKGNKVQHKGIKQMSFDECKKLNEPIKEFNQYYINLEKLNDIIIIDTDENEAYELVKGFLKENDLYDNDYITKSYKCQVKGLKYKRHFWLKMENKKDYDDIVNQQYKLKNDDNVEIGDLFINNGVIGEFKDVEIDFETLPEINRKEFDEFVELLNIPIKFKTDDKKEVKKEKKTKKEEEPEEENINNLNEIGLEDKINDKTLKKILDNLNTKRFDNYDYWLTMAMIFVNENLNLNIFNDYSKKSSKYNKDGNDKIINNLKQNKNGYSLNTLYLWLKEDDFETFKEVNKNRVDFWNILRNINHNELAKFYYNLMPNKYIRCSVDGWFEYNDMNILNNTKETPSSLLNNISNILQDIILEHRNYLKPSEKHYKEKMKLINSCFKMLGNSKFISGVIDYLKNYYTINELYKKIDNTKNIIAFNNCLFDLSIGTFRDIKPSDYVSKTTGYNINKKSNDKIRDELNKILLDIFDNQKMINYFKYVISSSFFGNKRQLIYIHTGSGANGKSLLGDLLKNTMGDYLYNVDSNFLTEMKSSGANSNLANSRGRRYLSVQEPEGEFLNVEFIKKITGQKEITTRELYKSNITFDVLFTPHLQCNIKPKLNKLDGGIVRRLNIINYPNKFVDTPTLPTEKKRDYNLPEKLEKLEYYNEYMLILLEHITKWRNVDVQDIDIPLEVSKEVDEYINDNNPLKAYLEKYYDITKKSNDKIKCTELLEHFLANDENERGLNRKTFVDYMISNNFAKKKSDGNYYYVGLKIK